MTTRDTVAYRHAFRSFVGRGFAALLFAAGLAAVAVTATGTPAYADHDHDTIVLVAHTGERVAVPYDYRGPQPRQFAGRSPLWHDRTHAQNHFWYHTVVSADHRFLHGSPRYQRSQHDFTVYQEVPRRFADRRRVRDQGFGHQGFGNQGFGNQGFGNHVGHGHDTGHHVAATSGRHGGSHRPSCQGINVGTLLGAAAGGFVGSNIGKGSGRLAATAAGTFLGAALGSQAGC